MYVLIIKITKTLLPGKCITFNVCVLYVYVCMLKERLEMHAPTTNLNKIENDHLNRNFHTKKLEINLFLESM